MLPEQVSPKRRRQIFYDETGNAQHFGASRREDASVRDDTSPEDTAPREDTHEDSWVTNFMARLAGLIRYIGGRK